MPESSASSENGTHGQPWSNRLRGAVSIGLAVYLLVVVLGPLSNPIASEHLTGPLARLVAPVHQALFLGHGYRFFGPDPGPSHLIVYKITMPEGHQVEGRFPDRNRHRPRLLYHRWFMLSETMFEEQALTFDSESFQTGLKELDEQISQLKKSGKPAAADELQEQRDEQIRQYDLASQRIELLATSIARYLLMERGGQSIELFIQERLIPLPQDVANGVKLNDRDFLSPLRKILELDPDASAAQEEIDPVETTSLSGAKE